MRKYWVAALALAFAANAGATIYKWVDAKGVTQYSETPPPAGVEAKSLTIDGRPAPATAEPAAKPAEGAATPAATPGARDAEADRKRAGESRQMFCDIAQRNVAALGRPGPVAEVNAEGQSMLLSDEQRAEALANAQRQVKTYCNQE